MNARLIVNPEGGRGDALARLADINARLRQRFETVEIALTVGVGDAEPLALQAAREGCTHLIAVGGDGTLNETINGVHASGQMQAVTLGLIPFGTGNDFARALGIGGEVDRAVEAIVHGQVRQVDLGSLNGRLFANASAGGFIAEVSDAASSHLKTLAGRLAYLIAGTSVLLDYEPANAQIRFDDGPSHVVGDGLHMFVVANGPTIGGGHMAAPAAHLDDGRLDVCLVRAATTKEFIGLLAKISVGGHLDDKHVTYAQAGTTDVEFERVVKVNTDGEVLEMDRCSYRVLPRAARFLVPSGTAYGGPPTPGQSGGVMGSMTGARPK